MNLSNVQKSAQSKIANLVAKKVPNPVDTEVSKRVQCLKMPIGKFFSMVEKCPPHPEQRDHERRLKTAQSQHVKKLKLPHTTIVFAYFKNQFFLTDGNHRAHFWLTDQEATVPAEVDVAILYPRTEAEYRELYSCYDSKKSAKNTRDMFAGACRDAGIFTELKSHMLATGAIATVWHRLAGNSRRKDELYRAVKTHKDALLALDKLGLKASQIPAGMVLGLLKLFKEHGATDRVRSYALEVIYAYNTPMAFVSANVGALLEGIEAIAKVNRRLSGEEVVTQLSDLVTRNFKYYRARPGVQMTRLATAVQKTA